MTLAEQIQKQLGELPPEKQSEVLDFVTFLRGQMQATHSVAANDIFVISRPRDDSRLARSAEEQRSERIKTALQTLAELGTFADITDPLEWQRQLRKDRPLPGRA